MRNHQSRLPLILILITLLSAADWAVAGAASRGNASLWSGRHLGVGGNSTYSGEPDTPGIRLGDGKATGGSSMRGISGDARAHLTAGIWIRLLQVRLFGQ